MNLSRPNKHKFFSINDSTIRVHTTTLIGSCNETKAFLFCDFHYFAFINGLMGVCDVSIGEICRHRTRAVIEQP